MFAAASAVRPISTHEIIGSIHEEAMVPPLLSHSRRSINATGPGVDDAVILNLTRQAWHSDPLQGSH